MKSALLCVKRSNATLKCVQRTVFRDHGHLGPHAMLLAVGGCNTDTVPPYQSPEVGGTMANSFRAKLVAPREIRAGVTRMHAHYQKGLSQSSSLAAMRIRIAGRAQLILRVDFAGRLANVYWEAPLGLNLGLLAMFKDLMIQSVTGSMSLTARTINSAGAPKTAAQCIPAARRA